MHIQSSQISHISLYFHFVSSRHYIYNYFKLYYIFTMCFLLDIGCTVHIFWFFPQTESMYFLKDIMWYNVAARCQFGMFVQISGQKPGIIVWLPWNPCISVCGLTSQTIHTRLVVTLIRQWHKLRDHTHVTMVMHCTCGTCFSFPGTLCMSMCGQC